VVEKLGVERIWLDEKLGFAVTKRERNWRDSDVPMNMIENSAFTKLGENVWLPRESQISYYPFPESTCSGQVAVTARLATRELSLTPAPSLFAPNLEGIVQAHDMTMLDDNRMTIKFVNIHNFDGEKLTEYLRTAPESLVPNPNNGVGGPLAGGRWKKWFLLVNLIAGCVIAFVIYLRRKAA
jgi:hypothetical protein